MTIKARDQVTISIGVDVASVDTYYKLQASTASVPQKPTTESPSGWSTTEPGYDGTTTNTLYTCQKTTLTDGTFYWGAVSKSSSYEAAKQAANGVNSLSQTVTTLSNNYATFKQETETFESTVGTTYAKKMEIDKLVSRGEQLVINGSLFMGDNTNFPPELVFDGSMANGTKGSVTRAAGSNAVALFMNDWFPIDANGDYYCSWDVIRDNSGNGKAYAFIYMNYRDVDKQTIYFQHWHRNTSNGDTLTQLARDLKSGDTKVYLNDVSKFAVSSNTAVGINLIVYDYTNSFGYTYPVGEYSRHFVGPWTRNDSSVFNLSENSISLTSAYSGSTIPAGTWVAQQRNGNNYQYFWYGFVPDTWTSYGHIVGKSQTYGGGYSIPSAAAEAKIGFLWNYYTTGASQGPTNEQARMWATNISVTKMGAIDEKLSTEIDQRKAQFGTCATSAAVAAKVVTLSNFELYTGAIIAVRFQYGNTASSPTLNVNGTGAKSVVVNGTQYPAAKYVTWNDYANCTFVYDGTYWRFTGSDQEMIKTVDVESRVSTAETSITQNQTDIALKANASDVYTKTQTDGLISTEVTNRNAAIALSADNIASTVAQTYTTKTEFNNLKIGGRNLFRKTENASADDWYLYNATVPENGILRLTPPTTSTAYGCYTVNYLDYSEYNNATYTFSFDIRRLSGTYTDKRLRIIIGFNTEARIGQGLSSTKGDASDYFGSIYIQPSEFGTDWKRINVTFDVPNIMNQGSTNALVNGSQLTVELYLEASGNPVEIKRIKLEKGTKPTDWTPAPEDIDAHFETVESSITQTADSIKESVSKSYATKNEAQIDRLGSGTSVAIDGAANAALKGLHILGKSVQDGMPTPSAPVEIQSVGAVNLLTGVSTGDGWLYSTFNAAACEYTRSNTATSENYIRGPVNMTFEPGQTYTLSCWAKSNGYVKSLDLYKVHVSGSGSHQQLQNIVLTTEYKFVRWTFTCDATSTETAYIRFDNNGSTESGIEAILYIKEPQLEVGDDTRGYVPEDGIGLHVMGRNLLNPKTMAVSPYYYAHEDGALTVYRADGRVWTSAYANTRTLMAGTYTLSADKVAGFQIGYYANGVVQVLLSNDNTTSITFTLPAESKAIIKVMQPSNGANTYPFDVHLQLELGSEATEYEPYRGTVTPILLQGHELRILPDGTQDELTVDADGRVTIVQRVGTITTASVTAYGFSTNANGSSFYVYPSGMEACVSSTGSDNVGLCSIGDYRVQSLDGTNHFYGYSTRVYYRTAAQLADTAEATAWANDNPFTIIYKLATPQTIDLGTIDMPQVQDGDVVEVIAAVTPSIDVTWWASAGQAVADAYASLSSAIEVKAESITSTVASTYATSEAVQAISSQIEQTANGWMAKFNQLTGGEDLTMTLAEAFEALGVTSANLEQIRSFVRITTDSSGDPLLLMGSATSPIMLALSNDSLEFRHGADRVAYIDVDSETNEGMLHITRAVVVKELQFGSWKWFEREGVGNMALKWIGEEE